MSASTAIRESFTRSFQLYRDLSAAMDADALRASLDPLPSNTVGEQLWCVVGARESYARAIEAGAWAGFTCSLQDTSNRAEVVEALARSEEPVNRALEATGRYSDAQHRLLLDLLEHEAAHHGQLIRYLYGLRIPIPESWKSRYALD